MRLEADEPVCFMVLLYARRGERSDDFVASTESSAAQPRAEV